jgi:hypothetical protein
MGACRLTCVGTGGLANAGDGHCNPSLLDALMILSRVPQHKPLLHHEGGHCSQPRRSAGARLMGFIPNTPLRAMVHLATIVASGQSCASVSEGAHYTLPINELQGFGRFARHAKVPGELA